MLAYIAIGMLVFSVAANVFLAKQLVLQDRFDPRLPNRRDAAAELDRCAVNARLTYERFVALLDLAVQYEAENLQGNGSSRVASQIPALTELEACAETLFSGLANIAHNASPSVDE